MRRAGEWRIVANALWAVPVLAVLLVIAQAAPCLACSCGLDTTSDRVRAAPVIFVGTVTSIEDTDAVWTTIGGAKEQRIRFAVEQVLKGETTVTTAVTTYPEDGFCGYRFAVGSRYTVFAQGSATSLCAGTSEPRALTSCASHHAIHSGQALDSHVV